MKRLHLFIIMVFCLHCPAMHAEVFEDNKEKSNFLLDSSIVSLNTVQMLGRHWSLESNQKMYGGYVTILNRPKLGEHDLFIGTFRKEGESSGQGGLYKVVNGKPKLVFEGYESYMVEFQKKKYIAINESKPGISSFKLYELRNSEKGKLCATELFSFDQMRVYDIVVIGSKLVMSGHSTESPFAIAVVHNDGKASYETLAEVRK